MKFWQMLVAVALALVGFSAMADGPDYASLVSAVNFTSVISSIISVAAVLAGVYVVRKGIKLVLGAIR